MTWDPEKYREKREKVLGVKKRGLSFGTLTIAVSCIILAGLVFLFLPGPLSYLKTRHLDDAIFKTELTLQIAEKFPDARVTAMKQAVMSKMQSIELFKSFSLGVSVLVVEAGGFAGVNFRTGGICLLMAAALSLLASLYPAVKAGRMDPRMPCAPCNMNASRKPVTPHALPDTINHETRPPPPA